MIKIVCAVCGKPESEHHAFEPLMPDGCICLHVEWGSEVMPICDHYHGDGEGRCVECRHDKGCHK